MKVDRNVWSAQKGNWVWVFTDRKKFAGQIVGVHRGEPGTDNEYTVELQDGSQLRVLQRELKRCRAPKRVRNTDWLQKREKR